MSWPLENLGNISEKVDYGLTASAINKKDGPRFLRITDLQDDAVNWEEVPSCACSNKETEQYQLSVGDIVFARTGATTGKSYLLKELPKPSVFASYLIRVRPKKTIVPQYLSYFFRSPRYWQQINNMANGAAQPGVNSTKLKELIVPIPPLKEQKHIATILDKADAIRRKRQQAIQLADQFLRSVFLDMFGDPVMNPKGWDEIPLSKLTSKIGSGATPRGGKEAYVEQGISLVRSLNVHDNKFLEKNLAFITQEQADGLSNVTVEENDVLLNITGASVCRSCIVPSNILPARVNQHVCIIRPKPQLIESSYLLNLLISNGYKKKLLSTAGASGATREALTKNQVEGLSIPTPPIELQNKFREITKKITSLHLKSHQVNKYPIFSSISQKAFAGEL